MSAAEFTLDDLLSDTETQRANVARQVEEMFGGTVSEDLDDEVEPDTGDEQVEQGSAKVGTLSPEAVARLLETAAQPHPQPARGREEDDGLEDGTSDAGRRGAPARKTSVGDSFTRAIREYRDDDSGPIGLDQARRRRARRSTVFDN